MSRVWMLKAFESQIRVCLFEYRQTIGHSESTGERKGVASLLGGFKGKDAWFLWPEDPGESVLAPWEVAQCNTTAHTEVAPRGLL